MQEEGMRLITQFYSPASQLAKADRILTDPTVRALDCKVHQGMGKLLHLEYPNPDGAARLQDKLPMCIQLDQSQLILFPKELHPAQLETCIKVYCRRGLVESKWACAHLLQYIQQQVDALLDTGVMQAGKRADGTHEVMQQNVNRGCKVILFTNMVTMRKYTAEEVLEQPELTYDLLMTPGGMPITFIGAGDRVKAAEGEGLLLCMGSRRMAILACTCMGIGVRVKVPHQEDPQNSTVHEVTTRPTGPKDLSTHMCAHKSWPLKYLGMFLTWTADRGAEGWIELMNSAQAMTDTHARNSAAEVALQTTVAHWLLNDTPPTSYPPAAHQEEAAPEQEEQEEEEEVLAIEQDPAAFLAQMMGPAWTSTSNKKGTPAPPSQPPAQPAPSTSYKPVDKRSTRGRGRGRSSSREDQGPSNQVKTLNLINRAKPTPTNPDKPTNHTLPTPTGAQGSQQQPGHQTQVKPRGGQQVNPLPPPKQAMHQPNSNPPHTGEHKPGARSQEPGNKKEPSRGSRTQQLAEGSRVVGDNDVTINQLALDPPCQAPYDRTVCLTETPVYLHSRDCLMPACSKPSTCLHAKSACNSPVLEQNRKKLCKNLYQQNRPSMIGGSPSNHHQHPPTNGPYIEAQEHRYCQIHAINAALGHRAIHPHAVQQLAEHTHNHITTVTGRPEGIRNIHYNTQPNPGNFSIELVNYYLSTTQLGYLTKLTTQHYTAQHPTTTPEQYTNGIQAGSSKDQVLSCTQGHTAIILHYTTSAGYGHATCLKQHNQAWYHINSENREATLLDTPQTWATVQGHMYTLTPNIPQRTIDRFNPHSSDWNNTHMEITIRDSPDWDTTPMEIPDSPTPQGQQQHMEITIPDSPTPQRQQRPPQTIITRLAARAPDHQATPPCPPNTTSITRLGTRAPKRTAQQETEQQPQPKRHNPTTDREWAVNQPQTQQPPTQNPPPKQAGIVEEPNTQHSQEQPPHTHSPKKEPTHPQPPTGPNKRKAKKGPTTGPMDKYIKHTSTTTPPQLPAQKATRQQPKQTHKQLSYKEAVLKHTGAQPTPHPPMPPNKKANNQHRPQDPTAPPKTCHMVSTATLNCRGIRTNYESIYENINHHKPDIMILTETKLTSGMKHTLKQLQRDLPEYQMHHSSQPKPNQTGTGAGGVILLIKNQYAHTITKIEVSPALAGNLCHVCIPTHNQNQLHVIGVYMPGENPGTQAQIYQYLQDQADQNKCTGQKILTGGDWNSALYPTDRSTNTNNTMDIQHQTQCHRIGMQPLNNNTLTRHHTFHSYQQGIQQHTSRIDDILICPPTLNPPGEEHCYESGTTLDHMLLITHTPSSTIPITPAATPTQPPTGPAQPILPIKKEYLIQTTATIAAELNTSFQAATNTIHTTLEQQLQHLQGNYKAESLQQLRTNTPHKKELINDLAGTIMTQLRQAHKILLQVCPTKPPTKGHFLKRTTSRAYQKLSSTIKDIKNIRRATGHLETHTSPEEIHSTQQDLQQHTWTDKALQTLQDMPQTGAAMQQWRINMGESITQAISQMDTIKKQQMQDQRAKSQEDFRTKLSTQAKTVHRTIFAKHTESSAPTAIRDKANLLHTDTEGILTLLTDHMSDMMAPPGHSKTGNYLPSDRDPLSQQAPWTTTGPDTFKLETVGQQQQHTTELTPLIMETTTYNNCIKHLARNKQPGPDGIPNELLGALPNEWHQTIHKLFTLMWILGETPTCWKTSTTIMLYKKGDHTNPANYRPIGLNNTMGKLWTAMTTTAIACYAENLGILSTAQEGFRAHRSTHRQILNLIHDIEDAALHKKDLYAAFFDFKSAFNMVDHDKLLCIMYDLGFPTDAIEVVKSIYEEATTRLTHNKGLGSFIQLIRGTIQGDTLSPLLFLIFIEPLHRWLKAGGRGYRQGCLTTQPALADQHNTGSLGYADDTTTLTNNPQDLQIQCDKVFKYSQWAGIPLNYTKCEVTAILHNTYPQDPTNTTLLTTQLHNKIIMGGAFATYTPPTQPCTYLGMQICLNLDWGAQVQHTIQLIKDKGDQIISKARGAGASPRQCLHLVQTCVKPAVAYTMVAAPYSTNDIARMDRAIAALAKQCCRLPKGFPNAAIHRPTSEAGLGIHSLMTDYTQITAATLTRALNDTDKLGHITRALLKDQATHFGDTKAEDLPHTATRYTSTLRQLLILHKAGIQIQKDDKDITATITPLITKLATLGEQDHQIPPTVLYPLHQLGIKDHTQLINQAGTHLITTTELQNLYGKAVKNCHMKALNRISIILSQQPPPGYTGNPAKYTKHGPIPSCCRKLLHPQPPRETTTAGNTQDIKSLLQSQNQNRRTGKATKPTPFHTHHRDTTPPSLPLTEIRWWQSIKNPYTQQENGDPTRSTTYWQDIWQQRQGLFNTKYFQQNHLTKRSTWQDLARVMEDPTNTTPLPPKLLHILYSNQYQITKLTSFKSSRDWEGTTVKEWTAQWAPTAITTNHTASMVNHLQSTLLQAKGYQTSPQHNNQLAQITWHDSPIREEDLLEMVTQEQYTQLTQAFAQQPKHKHVAPTPRLDLHLTNAQQQGDWTAPTSISLSTVKTVRDSIHINTLDTHPDCDIKGTGTYHIQIGLRVEGQEPTNQDKAYVYNPQGTCLGHIHTTRLHLLAANYTTTKTTQPHLYTQLGGTYLAADLASLLLRHRATQQTKHTHPSENCTLSPHIMQALSLGLHPTTERFASPLDHSPWMPHYHSPHPSDQLFGATHDAYQHHWTGCSIAHPTYTETGMHKAMRWAIASAQATNEQGQQAPTCTILILPNSPGGAYTSLLSHPMVHHLATVPRTMDPYANNTTWTGGKLTPTHTAPGHLQILAIANQTGHQQYLQYSTFTTTWAQALAALSNSTDMQSSQSTIPPYLHQTGPTVHPPKGLRPLLTQATPPPPPPPPGPPPHPQDYPCSTPIRPHKGIQIYTDGSQLITKQGTKTGAGIYNATTKQSTHLDPGGQGSTHTNNRAELCAILKALEQNPQGTLTIYTDSLCSMHNIQKMVDWPTRLQESKHKEILTNIVALLGARALAGHHTHIYKVRSHTGIKGNDAADTLAKEAAMQQGSPTLPSIHLGEQAHQGQHWPTITKPGTNSHILAPNLTQGIKAHLPSLTQRGPTRKAGMYADIWDTQLTTLHKEASSQYWTSSTLTWPQKLNLLRARWGHLWNKKLAYRYRRPYAGSAGPAATDRCPLCQCDRDGASHMLAGCRHHDMRAAYIKRHDLAVKLIQKSISKGQLGGAYTIMDAGKATDLPDSVQCKRLPESLRPTTIPLEAWRKMRPDILIIPSLKTCEMPDTQTRYNITLVEVGYCSDTNHNVKLREKQQQHAELVAGLRLAGHIVTMHPLTLGTTGTIHQNLRAALHALGVEKDAQLKVTGKLHQHATASASGIIAMRRHLEWQPGEPGT